MFGVEAMKIGISITSLRNMKVCRISLSEKTVMKADDLVVVVK